MWKEFVCVNIWESVRVWRWIGEGIPESGEKIPEKNKGLSKAWSCFEPAWRIIYRWTHTLKKEDTI